MRYINGEERNRFDCDGCCLESGYWYLGEKLNVYIECACVVGGECNPEPDVSREVQLIKAIVAGEVIPEREVKEVTIEEKRAWLKAQEGLMDWPFSCD